MPDLTKCKWVNKKLCCWDKESKRYVIVNIKPITDLEFLQEIVAAFAEDEAKKQGGREYA